MKNKSKRLSQIIKEIKVYAKSIIDAKHDADLREAFQVFDEDNSGEIDSEELREIMQKISSGIT